MRNLAQALAWLGIVLLIGLGFVLVTVLGFPGLLVLGLLATLVCVRAELSEDVPGWSRALFESRAPRPEAPEARVARHAAGQESRGILRYYRGCGLVLVVAGLLGSAWQLWRG